MQSKSDYRLDIDGLRAVAVLAVLFYHGGVKIFSGGYVGVDVFFVISGYLITTIISREIGENKFTLLNFYERRIRRIYPALFTVAIFTLFLSGLVYDAAGFEDIGNSLISVTFFYSNFHFWQASGYFEAPSLLKPFLHAWSLSVEEQFYILFPLLMVLIARFNKSRFVLSLALVALASFTLNVYWVNQDASAAFYLVQFRAWELLVGSLLALNIFPARIGSVSRNIFSLIGIMAIVTSVVLYSDETPFPGVAALAPILGSALVILSGRDGKSLVGNFLSLKPIVFIGKISYSLYLWHWPLLVIGKYYLIREPTAGELAIWLLVTFAVSALSWKYVENPFRDRSRFKRPRIFIFAGSVMTLLLIAGAVVTINDGLPHRYKENNANFLGKNDPVWMKWEPCLTSMKEGKVLNSRRCDIGSDESPPQFLLWGDSHARALAPAIDLSATQAGIAGKIIIANRCPPLSGIDRKGVTSGFCLKKIEGDLQYIKEHPELKTIILASRWAISADGTRYKTEEGADVTLVDLDQHKKGNNAFLFDLGLHRTVSKLIEMDRKVVIVNGVPEIGYDVPTSFSIASRTGRDVNQIIAPTFQEYLDRNRFVLDTINALLADGSITNVDPAKALCDENWCYVVVDGTPLYVDDDHLSPFGAHYISWLFDDIFEEMK